MRKPCFRLPYCLLAFLAIFSPANYLASQSPAPAELSQIRSSEQSPIKIDPEEVNQHRSGPHPELVIYPGDLTAQWKGISELYFELTVSPAGEVTKIDHDFSAMGKGHQPVNLIHKAELMLQALKYKPFVRLGKPVWAKFGEDVFLYPPAILPSKHIPFPDLPQNSPERANLLITLRRTRCYGFCPAYKIQIHGNGDVEFDGEAFVAVSGHHKASISPEAVNQLLDMFRDADFFSLDDAYRSLVTDNPAYCTSITLGSKSKSVYDYVGREDGMPASVEMLEKAIDDTADSARWIVGDKLTAASLAAEHYDFHSEEAEDLLASVAERGDTDAVRALLAAGTPVKPPRMSDAPLSLPGVFTRSHRPPVVSATIFDNMEMLQLLLDAGADANEVDARTGSTALMKANTPEIVQALLSAGADPTISDKRHQSAIDLAKTLHQDWKLQLLQPQIQK